MAEGKGPDQPRKSCENGQEYQMSVDAVHWEFYIYIYFNDCTATAILLQWFVTFHIFMLYIHMVDCWLWHVILHLTSLTVDGWVKWEAMISTKLKQLKYNREFEYLLGALNIRVWQWKKIKMTYGNHTVEMEIVAIFFMCLSARRCEPDWNILK